MPVGIKGFQVGHKINIGNSFNKGRAPWNKGKKMTRFGNPENWKHSEKTKRKIGLANSIALKGRIQSTETKRKIGKANTGKNNGMWKGNKIGFQALHGWIKTNHKNPDLCQICKKVPPYDLANINPKYNPKTYTRNIKNWEWLCRKCHMEKDGRMKNLKQYKQTN